MRSQILRLMALTVLFTAISQIARADVCVSIDHEHDSFSTQEQSAAIVLIEAELEQAGEHLVPAPCPSAYSVSHARLGDLIVVTITGPKGQREAIAHGMDDLPSLYDQMVLSMVTGKPMTGLNVVNRTNVTVAQSMEPRRVHSESLWYAKLGYGGLFGDNSYGTPALGFGYRAEMDSLAIDVSFLNLQFQPSHFYSSREASAASFLKLSGLYFVTPTSNRSPYFGGGLSYGRSSFGGDYGYINNPGRFSTNWEGSGLQGELTAGYELARATNFRVFLQGDAVLPFYQVESQTFTRFGMPVATDRRYAPSFIFSIGIGR
jgi:hypothetical protein